MQEVQLPQVRRQDVGQVGMPGEEVLRVGRDARLQPDEVFVQAGRDPRSCRAGRRRPGRSRRSRRGSCQALPVVELLEPLQGPQPEHPGAAGMRPRRRRSRRRGGAPGSAGPGRPDSPAATSPADRPGSPPALDAPPGSLGESAGARGVLDLPGSPGPGPAPWRDTSWRTSRLWARPASRRPRPGN